MAEKLHAVAPKIINISPVPPNGELLKRYKIRDENDLKILYSVEMTDSVILVTMDDDFTDVKGLKAKIMWPDEYLYENGGKRERPRRGP